MLSEIEKFIFGGDIAHDIIDLKKFGKKWLLTVRPAKDLATEKTFQFYNATEIYEYFIDENEELKFPLPIIGFDAISLPDDMWKFCLNAADVEWAFVSEWPRRQ